MRSYPRNSPEAAARIVALVLISDGHVCRSEIETLHRLQIERELGLAPGRQLGELLHHLTRERAFGRIPEADPAGRAVAIDTARAWLGRR